MATQGPGRHSNSRASNSNPASSLLSQGTGFNPGVSSLIPLMPALSELGMRRLARRCSLFARGRFGSPRGASYGAGTDAGVRDAMTGQGLRVFASVF